MTKVIPYVMVKNALNAINTYTEVFDAKVLMREKFNEHVAKDMNLPKDFDFENSTMHARIQVGDTLIYLSDDPEAETKTNQIELNIEFSSEEEIKKVFEKCKSKGWYIGMNLDKMFWGALYAKVKDPFGIGWQFNFELPKDAK